MLDEMMTTNSKETGNEGTSSMEETMILENPRISKRKGAPKRIQSGVENVSKRACSFCK